MTEERKVYCIKLKKELPGLIKPPATGELGQKIFENVSKEAFKMFLEHFKLIVNEYRLDLTSPETDKDFEKHLNEFFFGEGIEFPEDYIPPKE